MREGRKAGGGEREGKKKEWRGMAYAEGRAERTGREAYRALGFCFSGWDTPLPVPFLASWGVLFWKSDSFFILGDSQSPPISLPKWGLRQTLLHTEVLQIHLHLNSNIPLVKALGRLQRALRASVGACGPSAAQQLRPV